jgi:abortive infection bacteriophage resistance protein
MGSSSSPLNTYSKPFLSVADQVKLLQSRGLAISNLEAAHACLERIGYYRLSGYWYPFRKSHLSVNPVTQTPLLDLAGKRVIVVEDEFRPGSTFQQVMALYVFDKLLRLIFLDAIERVEIALRVDLALLLGQRSPLAHRDPLQFSTSFRRRNSTGSSEHDKWLERLDSSYLKSNEEFVKHFKIKYPRVPPPIWVAIELWDFGMLSVLLGGLTPADKSLLASKYLLPRPELLHSLVRNINNIRNICAHHSRLWNRSPADRLSPTKRGEIPLLDHLAMDKNGQSRVYATAAFIQFLLKTINPGTSWSQRLKDHMKTLPSRNGIDSSQAGFPNGWENFTLWQ